MFLSEFITSILYHYTSISNATSIMKNNKFNLSPAINGVESSFQKNGKYYYLSTARSRTNDFNSGALKSSVIFKLDGTKLSQKYKGSPVNYFSTPRSMRDETEDRIQSATPSIPSLPYITEVTILYNVTYHAAHGENSSKLFGQDILTILAICEENNIPCYIYSNPKDFMVNNKKNAINPNKDVLNKSKEEPKKILPTDKTFVNSLTSLITKNENDELNRSEKNVLIDLSDIGNSMMFYYRAFPEEIQHIISLMKKNKLKNTKELQEFLRKKWKI